MAEAAQAFLLTQYYSDADALADDALRRREAEKDVVRTWTPRSIQPGDTGRSSNQPEATPELQRRDEAGGRASRLPPPDNSCPIMRRASWVDAQPNPQQQQPTVSGFGLPRTPLRLLSLAAGASRRHALPQLAHPHDSKNDGKSHPQQQRRHARHPDDGDLGAEGVGQGEIAGAAGPQQPRQQGSSTRSARTAWAVAVSSLRAGNQGPDASGLEGLMPAPRRRLTSSRGAVDQQRRQDQDQGQGLRGSSPGRDTTGASAGDSVAAFVAFGAAPPGESGDGLDRIGVVSSGADVPAGAQPPRRVPSRRWLSEAAAVAAAAAALASSTSQREATPGGRGAVAGAALQRLQPTAGEGRTDGVGDGSGTAAGVVTYTPVSGARVLSCAPGQERLSIENDVPAPGTTIGTVPALHSGAAQWRLRPAMSRSLSRLPTTGRGQADQTEQVVSVDTTAACSPIVRPQRWLGPNQDHGGQIPTEDVPALLPGQADASTNALGLSRPEAGTSFGSQTAASTGFLLRPRMGGAAVGAAPNEVEWWLQATRDDALNASGRGHSGSGSGALRRRRRHWQRDSGRGSGASDGDAGGGGDGMVSGWHAAAYLHARDALTGCPGKNAGNRSRERVPWHVLAFDLWSSMDRWLPLFLPSRARDSWDVFLLLLLLYTAAVVPLEAGFHAMRRTGLQVVDTAVLGAFWLDVGVQFRTAYISDTGELVRNTRSIAAHYFRTWLLLDVASSLPWSEILQAILGGTNHHVAALLTLLRMTRLLKFIRLMRFLDRFRYANLLRLGRLFATMLLVAHWTACVWHGMSEALDGWPWIFDALKATGETGMTAQYSFALYSSFVLVVGSDNLTAHNNLERVFYIVMLLVGAVIYALLVSNMAVLAANLNALSSRYRTKAAMAADALRYVGAPAGFQDRVEQYYEFLAENEHPGPEADAFLSELPRGLLEDIKWCLYSNPFHRLALFAGCDEPFMAALEARLTLLAFTPGEVIFREGEAGQHMYLVRQGVVLLRSPRGDLLRLVGRGEAFNELALLPDLAARRQTCTALAVRPTDLVVLAGRDLAAACKDHPLAGSLVQERLVQQLEDRLNGTEWSWFVDKVLVREQLSRSRDDKAEDNNNNNNNNNNNTFSSSLALLVRAGLRSPGSATSGGGGGGSSRTSLLLSPSGAGRSPGNLSAQGSSRRNSGREVAGRTVSFSAVSPAAVSRASSLGAAAATASQPVAVSPVADASKRSSTPTAGPPGAPAGAALAAVAGVMRASWAAPAVTAAAGSNGCSSPSQASSPSPRPGPARLQSPLGSDHEGSDLPAASTPAHPVDGSSAGGQVIRSPSSGPPQAQPLLPLPPSFREGLGTATGASQTANDTGACTGERAVITRREWNSAVEGTSARDRAGVLGLPRRSGSISRGGGDGAGSGGDEKSGGGGGGGVERQKLLRLDPAESVACMGPGSSPDVPPPAADTAANLGLGGTAKHGAEVSSGGGSNGGGSRGDGGRARKPGEEGLGAAEGTGAGEERERPQSPLSFEARTSTEHTPSALQQQQQQQHQQQLPLQPPPPSPTPRALMRSGSSSRSRSRSRGLLRNVSGLLSSLVRRLRGEGGPGGPHGWRSREASCEQLQQPMEGVVPEAASAIDTTGAADGADTGNDARPRSFTAGDSAPLRLSGRRRVPAQQAPGDLPSISEAYETGLSDRQPGGTQDGSGLRSYCEATRDPLVRPATPPPLRRSTSKQSPQPSLVASESRLSSELRLLQGDRPAAAAADAAAGGAAAATGASAAAVGGSARKERSAPRRVASLPWLAAVHAVRATQGTHLGADVARGGSEPPSTTGGNSAGQPTSYSLLLPGSADEDRGGGGIPSLVLRRWRSRGKSNGGTDGAVRGGTSHRHAGVDSQAAGTPSLLRLSAAEAWIEGFITPRGLDGGSAVTRGSKHTDPHAQLQSALALLARALGVEPPSERPHRWQASGGGAAATAAATAVADGTPGPRQIRGGAATPAVGASASAAALDTSLLFLEPSNRRLLLALADAVVRQEGGQVPAVRDLLERRGQEVAVAAQAQMERLLGGVANGVEGIEQTVCSLDESLTLACRRLAVIERDVLEAQSVGVLAGGLLRELSTDSIHAERVGAIRALLSDDEDEGGGEEHCGETGPGSGAWRQQDCGLAGSRKCNGAAVANTTSFTATAASGDLDPVLVALLRLPEAEQQQQQRHLLQHRGNSNSAVSRDAEARLPLQQQTSGGGSTSWSPSRRTSRTAIASGSGMAAGTNSRGGSRRPTGYAIANAEGVPGESAAGPSGTMHPASDLGVPTRAAGGAGRDGDAGGSGRLHDRKGSVGAAGTPGGNGSGRVQERKCGSGAPDGGAGWDCQDAPVFPSSYGGSGPRRRSMDATGFFWLQRQDFGATAPPSQHTAGGAATGGPSQATDSAADSPATTTPHATAASMERTADADWSVTSGVLGLGPDAGGANPAASGLVSTQQARSRRRSRASLTILAPHESGEATEADAASLAFPAGAGPGAGVCCAAGGSGVLRQSQGQIRAARSRRASLVMMQAGMLAPQAAATSPASLPSPTSMASTLARQRRPSSFLAVLEDNVVQDSAAVGRGQAPGLAPSERPGARRAPAPAKNTPQRPRLRSNTADDLSGPISATHTYVRASTTGSAAAAAGGLQGAHSSAVHPAAAAAGGRRSSGGGGGGGGRTSSGGFERVSDPSEAGWPAGRPGCRPTSRRASVASEGQPASRRASIVGGHELAFMVAPRADGERPTDG